MAVINPSETGIGELIRGKLGKDLGLATPDTWGIYQVRTRWGGLVQVKEKFYVPTNPQTELQQYYRAIFAAGVLAWQGLSEPERDTYRERSKGLEMTGFNLFMSEYLYSA